VRRDCTCSREGLYITLDESFEKMYFRYDEEKKELDNDMVRNDKK
jgi:hypothetical protein